MTSSPENKPKLKFSAAERALGEVRLVTAGSDHEDEEQSPPPIPADLPVSANANSSAVPAHSLHANSGGPQESPSVPLEPARRKFDQWYEIIGEIRADATTTSYKAIDVSNNEVVCIKVLQPYLLEKTKAAQVLQHRLAEAQTLTHAFIVPVKAMGINDDGHTYVVEEFRDGITLKELLLRARFLAPKTAIDVFTQICEALGYAHERGIVHGNLKADDIILLPNGGGYTAQVANFAVDSLIPTRDEDVQRLTGGGILLGAELAEYLSPEQCIGNPPDPRSDIYALGCIMYEAISGRKVVEAKSFVQALTRQINETPPSFVDICHERQISEAMEAVIFKCLNKKPDERYQRTAALKQALVLPQVLTGPPKPRVANIEVIKHGVDHGNSQMRKIAWMSGAIVGIGLIAATLLVWIPNHVPMDGDPGQPKQAQNQAPPLEPEPPPAETPQPSSQRSQLSDIDMALEKNPADANALLARAQISLGKHSYIRALEDLDARSKILPEKWSSDEDVQSAILGRIDALLHTGKVGAAAALANQVYKSDPKNPKALMAKVDVQLAAGHSAEALAGARRLVKEAPKSADGFLRLARAENAKGEWAKAIEAAAKAEELAPQSLWSYGEHVKALNALKRHDEAEALCFSVFNYTTDFAEAYIWLGETYIAQRRFDEAIYEFSQAGGLESNNPGAYIGVARVYLKQANYERCISEAQKVLRFDKQNAAAYEVMSEAYKLMGDKGKAHEMRVLAHKYAHGA